MTHQPGRAGARSRGIDTPVTIASPANERIKAVLRLRDRRERDETGLTVVTGARECRRALEAGAAVETLFVTVRAEVGPPLDEDLAACDSLAQARGLVPVPVVPAVAERIAFGDRDDGIVAVIRRPGTALGDLQVGSAPLLVVIDGVEKPGNVGAILRSADGAGADGVIVTDPATDLYNPNAIRASIGTIFALRPVAADAPSVRAWLRERGIRVVAARVDGARLHHEADLTGPLALVLGSESAGLGADWEGPEVEAVRLPMRGLADSLNVSAAAAVLLYEARRQRG